MYVIKSANCNRFYFEVQDEKSANDTFDTSVA